MTFVLCAEFIAGFCFGWFLRGRQAKRISKELEVLKTKTAALKAAIEQSQQDAR